MVPPFFPFLPLLSFSAIPEKAPNLSRISMDPKNKNKTHWTCIFPLPTLRQAKGRWAEADNSQGGEEEPEWTRMEAREDQRESVAWRNDAEESWQQSTHLGIDIRVKGAVLFEFFDLKSILQKGEEKKMWW